MNKNLKRRWVVLRKMKEEETTTGYMLIIFKDKSDEERGKDSLSCFFLADPIFDAEPVENEVKESKKKFGFHLKSKDSNDGEQINGVFGTGNIEDRDDWVTKINEALASQKQNDNDENSDPEEDLDEDRLSQGLRRLSIKLTFVKNYCEFFNH